MSRRRACVAYVALLALLSVLAPWPAAGTPPEEASGLATRVFNIQYKTVDAVYLLVSPALGPLGSIRAEPHRRTLTVADTPQNLRRIADLIASFDIPPRSVEVSVQLILASSGPGSVRPVPPPIRGVIERLSALSTRWNDYRLLGNARVLSTEGEASSLQVGDRYRVDFRVDEISGDSRIIRFKPFELRRREMTVEGRESYSRVMRTVLNLRDSQLFIVGASRMERSNRALFMTITASLQGP
ncbi:MAG: secretin N-terminal domain-containing protein [Acidobacteriota bacterium]